MTQGEIEERDPRLDRFQERCRGYAAALLPHSRDEKVWDAAMTYLDLSACLEGIYERLDEFETLLHLKYPDAEEPKEASADFLFGLVLGYEAILEKITGRKTETEENEK